MKGLNKPLPLSARRDAAGNKTEIDFEDIRVAPTGGYYVFEHVLYDTVTVLAAGGAQNLPAFGQATGPARAADDTLTNWPAGGLPRPHRFHGLRLFATPLAEPTLAGAVDSSGRLRDIERVWRVGRTMLDFGLGATGRKRPSVPLRVVPSCPGVFGDVAGGTAAAQNPIQHVDQVGDGLGFPFDLPLSELESFSIGIRTSAALTALTADLPIALDIYGWYYMPVG